LSISSRAHANNGEHDKKHYREYPVEHGHAHRCRVFAARARRYSTRSVTISNGFIRNSVTAPAA
jgi:hypothetical protein